MLSSRKGKLEHGVNLSTVYHIRKKKKKTGKQRHIQFLSLLKYPFTSKPLNTLP